MPSGGGGGGAEVAAGGATGAEGGAAFESPAAVLGPSPAIPKNPIITIIINIYRP